MAIGRPSHSTIVAYVALIAALGGGAYAAVKVNSADIQNKTIKGKDVKPDALGGKQISEAKLARVPDADALDGLDSTAFLRSADSASFLGTSAIRSGRGDEGAVPAQTILDYPDFGVRVETDGDADTDDSLVIRNTGSVGEINFVADNAGGSTTVAPGATGTYPGGQPFRVVAITIGGRYTTGEASRAVQLTCGFPLGRTTFCVGIDIPPP